MISQNIQIFLLAHELSYDVNCFAQEFKIYAFDIFYPYNRLYVLFVILVITDPV